MDFMERVLYSVRRDLQTPEGACGICHLTLEKLSLEGGMTVTYELPDGVGSLILDDGGEVIGEGMDIVWAPSILDAQIDAGLIPEEIARPLRNILTRKKDRIRVSQIFGYGRCVTPAGVGISLIWGDGGRVEIHRKGLAVEAVLYDENGNLLSEATSAFCPICAINISISRNKALRNRVSGEMEGKSNTGRLKYERGIENISRWKKRRVITRIRENNRIIGRNWGCCIAYATLRAEIDAGFGSERWNRLFKNYCDFCPLKHCWLGKSMGALGNILLERMKEVDVKERVSMNDYITAHIYDGERQVAQGIGTLCSLSATVNAYMRADAVEILKPSRAHGFPYTPKK